MSWADIVVPLLVGLVPALLTYLGLRRSLKVERDKAEAQAAVDERKTAIEGNAVLAQISGGAVEVVTLLRDEVRRLSSELESATAEIVRLKGKLLQSEEEGSALLALVEANGRRSDEMASELSRAVAIIEILRSDVAALKRSNRDLLRQNGILIEVAEKTVTQ